MNKKFHIDLKCTAILTKVIFNQTSKMDADDDHILTFKSKLCIDLKCW